jgi:hypothetical protein
MHKSCVIDTSSLVYLTALAPYNIFHHLRFFTNQLHIPPTVKEEYERGLLKDPARQKIIEKLRINEGFFSYCTRYDTITLEILKTARNVDLGEAHVAAQQKFVQAQYIISDDQPFIDSIRSVDKYVKIINSLYLIAYFHYLGLPNTVEMLRKLRSVRTFSQVQWQSAFRNVVSDLGVYISKKEFNNRTQFKKIRL